MMGGSRSDGEMIDWARHPGRPTAIQAYGQGTGFTVLLIAIGNNSIALGRFKHIANGILIKGLLMYLITLKC